MYISVSPTHMGVYTFNPQAWNLSTWVCIFRARHMACVSYRTWHVFHTTQACVDSQFHTPMASINTGRIFSKTIRACIAKFLEFWVMFSMFFKISNLLTIIHMNNLKVSTHNTKHNQSPYQSITHSLGSNSF